MKRNAPILGFVIGVILPFIGMFIFHLVVDPKQHFSSFLGSMVSRHDIASKVLSLSILMNIIPFIFYTNKRLDYTARGIFIATMLYALLILLLKFVW